MWESIETVQIQKKVETYPLIKGIGNTDLADQQNLTKNMIQGMMKSKV